MDIKYGYRKEWGKNISIDAIPEQFHPCVDIPERIDGNRVIGVSYWEYHDFKYIRKIRLPKTVQNMNFGLNDPGHGVCYESFEVDKKNKAFWTDGYALYTHDRKRLLYFNNTELEEYVIPEGVEIIENFGAVAKMKLKRLVIPDSVQCILPPSFWGCDLLEDVHVSPLKLGYGQKYGLGALRHTEWFKRHLTDQGFCVEKIPGGCYIQAIVPTGDTVQIPESIDGLPVKGICIEGMDDIQKIYLPANVEIFDVMCNDDQYESYPVINSFEVDEGNQAFKTDGRALYSGDGSKLVYLSASTIEEYEALPGTVSVDRYAVGRLGNLRRITFPDSTTQVHATFQWCPKLTKILGGANILDISHKDTIAFICPWLDVGKRFIRPLYIGKVLVLVGKTIQGKYDIPDAIEVLERESFHRIRTIYGITKLVLPNTIRIIKQNAFLEDEYLEEIVLPMSIEQIEDGAFNRCKGLRKVAVPSDKLHLLHDAFTDCDGVEIEAY